MSVILQQDETETKAFPIVPRTDSLIQAVVDNEELSSKAVARLGTSFKVLFGSSDVVHVMLIPFSSITPNTHMPTHTGKHTHLHTQTRKDLYDVFKMVAYFFPQSSY